ncbi:signal peptidase I [Pseudonocardia sp. GCM10023141]|uniref:signal peptidase I n=1 Tax=Pseudonocardia sp. GCM10023141 TaxID=3252653 RepID=UPI003612B026
MRRAAIAAALTIAVVAVLVGGALALGGYRVHGPSMEPALTDGAVVLANPADHSPARFDEVVYLPAEGGAAVKRVIGLPGDRVRIVPAGPAGPEVQVQVSGTGPWLRATAAGTLPWTGAEACCGADGRSSAVPADAVVPAGSYFLLGDNRAVSIDSRRQGFVAAKRLRGTVLFGSGATAPEFRLTAP